jgi:hypothetical protein
MFFAIFTPFYMSALLYQNHTIMRANKNILKRLLEEEKKNYERFSCCLGVSSFGKVSLVRNFLAASPLSEQL